MWSFDHENERSTAEFALSMQSIPIMLECRGSKKTDSLYVLSVSEKGIAYVWHLKSMSRDGVLRTKILVDDGKGGKKDRVPIVSAMLCYAEEDAQASVLVSFGSLDNLQFRFVEMNDSGKDIYLTADNEILVDKTLRTHTDSNAEGLLYLYFLIIFYSHSSFRLLSCLVADLLFYRACKFLSPLSTFFDGIFATLEPRCHFCTFLTVESQFLENNFSRGL